MLQKSLEQFRPNPLGQEIKDRANGERSNLHTIADRIAIEAAPAEVAPAFLKPSKAKIDRIRKQLGEAEQEQAAIVRDYQNYQNLLGELAERKQNLESGKFREEQAKNDIATLQDDLKVWPKKPWHHVVERVNSAVFAEKLFQFLPAWIEETADEVAKLEQQINTLAKKYAE